MASSPKAHLRYPLPAAFVRQVRTLFDVRGYLVLEDAIDAEELGQLRGDLLQLPLPERGDFRPLVGHSDALLRLVDHPRLLPYVLALMGGAIQLASSCVTVVPAGAAPMVWHEDGPRPWSYPDVDSRRPLNLLRIGIYLDDLTQPERGQLSVVAGSHHVPFHRAERVESLRRLGVATDVCVRAGTAVLFHNGLWHSTAPNLAPSPRVAIYLGYTPVWHRLIDYAEPPADWVDRVDRAPASRRALMRQLLGAVPPSGPSSFMFPSESEFPGLALVAPEHPASGS